MNPLAIEALAEFLKSLLTPFTNIPESTFLIGAIALTVASGSSLLNRRLVDFKKLREKRMEFEAWNKQLREARSKNDKQAIAKLMKKNQAMMQAQSQMMMATMKPSMIIMGPILIMWWILGLAFPGTLIVAHSPFPIPWITGGFENLNFVAWYIIVSFAFSLPLGRILGTSPTGT